MSYGTMCLICRHYITDAEWGCRCSHPIPSDDGKTPNPLPPPPSGAAPVEGES